MRRLFVVVVSFLCAGRAGAPPPLGGFPAVVAPADGATAPPNARVWAFGADAPPPSSVGVSIDVDGTAASFTKQALGCCGIVVVPDAALAGTVDVVVAEATASFAIGGAPDETAPTLDAPAVLDEGEPMVLGVQGDDDVALAGFLAKHGDAIVSATSTDATLAAPTDADGCVDVVAVDLAGNESAPRRACRAVEPPDAGPGEPPPGGGCAASGTTSSTGALCVVALALQAARTRRRRAATPT